ncbi:hypothetical protein [Novosphingobium kunmingense]|uniref:hypothetical protein n=1 Tax=Novosphingobium kunmingense TaxID=1211806 RepID=UPI0018E22A70|nr:hypothetical protein [Novosphingobium kunmingense]
MSLIALSLATGGCATKRYGRLQPLTAAEGQYYDCNAIEIEIAKIEAFRQQVADGARFNGASVMGFLGDWGIGNANEKNAAERTATERMTQLLALKAQKGCTARIQPAAGVASTPAPLPAPALAPAAEPIAAPTGNSRVKCVTCRD